MALTIVPLFGTGSSGRAPAVSSQDRLNFYAERVADGDKSTLVFYPTPGLATWATVTSAKRAIGLYYWAALNRIVSVDTDRYIRLHNSAGTADATTPQHATPVAEWASIAEGMNGSNPNILIASNKADGTGKLSSWNGSAGSVTAVTYPGTITQFDTVTYLDGYWIGSANGMGRFYISALQDPSSWSSTDFATAESSPDNLLRVQADRGRLICWGRRSIEFWSNTGAASFPFAPVRGSTLEFGIPHRDVVAPCTSGTFFVGQNNNGGLFVGLLQGGQVSKVSNPDIERQLTDLAITSAYGPWAPSSGITFRSFAYEQSGHTFYDLTVRTGVSDEVTTKENVVHLLYDHTSQTWSRRMTGNYLINDVYQVNCAAMGFSDVFIGSRYTNDIFALREATYTDNSEAITREIVTRHVFQNHERFSVNELYVDFDLAQGTSGDQEVTLYVSRDGGRNFGTGRTVTIGYSGESGKQRGRAVWRRLGTSRDFVFKLSMNDARRYVITGGAMAVSR